VGIGWASMVSLAENKSILFLIFAIALALSAVAWLLVGDDDRDMANEGRWFFCLHL